jgi:hypothetical protein
MAAADGEDSQSSKPYVVEGFTLEQSRELAEKALDKLAIALAKRLAQRCHEADLKQALDDHEAPPGEWRSVQEHSIQLVTDDLWQSTDGLIHKNSKFGKQINRLP